MDVFIPITHLNFAEHVISIDHAFDAFKIFWTRKEETPSIATNQSEKLPSAIMILLIEGLAIVAGSRLSSLHFSAAFKAGATSSGEAVHTSVQVP